MANTQQIECRIGMFSAGAIECSKLTGVDFIQAGLNINDKKFACVLGLNLSADLLLVNLLPASDNLFASIP
jgi:hypothetical protein